VFVIKSSGQAYFSIGELDGIAYETIWSADLDLPTEVPTVTSPALPNFTQNVPLQPLLQAIRRLLAEH
jgi:hypothetical protein